MKHFVSVSIIASLVIFSFIIPGCQSKPKEEMKPAREGKEMVGEASKKGEEMAGEAVEAGKETVGEAMDSGKEMTRKPESGEIVAEGKAMSEDTGREIEQGLINRVRESGLDVKDFNVEYREGTATIRGRTPSQEEREKITLLVGNSKGVSRVNDQLTVGASASDAVMYTVKSGDTLIKIAEEHYGNPEKFTEIFEANRPMLTDPDSIYPGQVLRIPPLEG